MPVITISPRLRPLRATTGWLASQATAADGIAEHQVAAAAGCRLGPVHAQAHRVPAEIEAAPVAHRLAPDDRRVAAAIRNGEHTLAREAALETAADDLEGGGDEVDRGRHLTRLVRILARRQIRPEADQELALEPGPMAGDQRDLGAVRMAVRREQRADQRLVDVQQLCVAAVVAPSFQPTRVRPASPISAACTS